MLGLIRAGDFVVALEVGGKPMSTGQLALWLEARRRDGQDLVFLIGGPDGLAPGCRERADLGLSLSALTFPHSLARVMLIEQLYRANSLNKGVTDPPQDRKSSDLFGAHRCRPVLSCRSLSSHRGCSCNWLKDKTLYRFWPWHRWDHGASFSLPRISLAATSRPSPPDRDRA
jgi:hypothetical protein